MGRDSHGKWKFGWGGILRVRCGIHICYRRMGDCIGRREREEQFLQNQLSALMRAGDGAQNKTENRADTQKIQNCSSIDHFIPRTSGRWRYAAWKIGLKNWFTLGIQTLPLSFRSFQIFLFSVVLLRGKFDPWCDPAMIFFSGNYMCFLHFFHARVCKTRDPPSTDGPIHFSHESSFSNPRMERTRGGTVKISSFLPTTATHMRFPNRPDLAKYNVFLLLFLWRRRETALREKKIIFCPWTCSAEKEKRSSFSRAQIILVLFSLS